jgi:hypothetical protein
MEGFCSHNRLRLVSFDPRFKMHFTPTSSSWLNLVERFFADLTGDVIRAGSFASVKDWCTISRRISKIKRARVALDKAEAA